MYDKQIYLKPTNIKHPPTCHYLSTAESRRIEKYHCEKKARTRTFNNSKLKRVKWIK